MTNISVSPIEWTEAKRIIRERSFLRSVFSDIADNRDEHIISLGADKTNPLGYRAYLNADAVASSRGFPFAGTYLVTAPFTNFSTAWPSRFSNGEFGVLYAGREFQTALKETIHHHEKFMASTSEDPCSSTFVELTLHIRGQLHEVKRDEDIDGRILHPSDYTHSQALGNDLYRSRSSGIVYPSVRHPGGMCAGLFYADLVKGLNIGQTLEYKWDGSRVNSVRNRQDIVEIDISS